MNREVTQADNKYYDLLDLVNYDGNILMTRNHEVKSHVFLDRVHFTETPLVTVRKTAWKKAIREMEWFFSGKAECPEELRDWWSGQLQNEKYLYRGYSQQFRAFTTEDYPVTFDQVKFILEGLKNNPNSRRLLKTVWHPQEMAQITQINNNPNTPTCCHSIVVQFFVRNQTLHMTTYQRSADLILGVPHNWIQSWAMLMYYAHHAELSVGTMNWVFGDAHIYMEPSHIAVVEEILNEDMWITLGDAPKLLYNPKPNDLDSNGVPVFRAEDFSLEGRVFDPITTIKPKLL